MNHFHYYSLWAVGMVVLIGCGSPMTTKTVSTAAEMPTPPRGAPNELKQVSETDLASALLTFSLELNQKVYEYSDWGEPPQFAIWLEDADSSRIRTIWVTYRTGTGDWKGKVECPVALPYWVSRYNKETATSGPPTFFEPVIDAITGATPKQDIIHQPY